MGALNSLATLGLNLALSQRAQANESKELRQERDRQIQAIRLRDAEDGRQQEQALRRRLAEERARAGGAGVGSSGGSADAILAGLVQESRLPGPGAPPGIRAADRRHPQHLRRPPQAQPARLRRPLGRRWAAGSPARRGRAGACSIEPLATAVPRPARATPVAAPAGRRRGPAGRPALQPLRDRLEPAAGPRDAGRASAHGALAGRALGGGRPPPAADGVPRRRQVDAGRPVLRLAAGPGPEPAPAGALGRGRPRHQDDPQRAPRARAQPADPASPAQAARGVGGGPAHRRSARPPIATRRCWPAASAPTSPAAAPTSSSATMSRCPTPPARSTSGWSCASACARPAFVLVPDGTQLYIGTPHSYYSIYADEARPELDEAAPFLAELHAHEHPAARRGAGRASGRTGSRREAVDGMQHDSGPNRFRSQMILTPGHTRDVRLDPGPAGPLRGAGCELREVNGEPMLTIDGRRMVGTACWWDPAMARPEAAATPAWSPPCSPTTAAATGCTASAICRSTRPRSREADAAAQLCRQVIAFLRAQRPAGDRDRDQRPRPLPAARCCAASSTTSGSRSP